MNKLFTELKSKCKTSAQRKAFNNLIKSFSDDNPTPEQKGIIEYLKGWVEEHPGEAKYLAELGAKWGPDHLVEGLNYDAEDHDTFASKFPDIYFVISKKNVGVCIYTFGKGQTFDPADKETTEGLQKIMQRQYKDYDVDGPMTKDEAKSLADSLARKYGVKVHANPFIAKGWLKRND